MPAVNKKSMSIGTMIDVITSTFSIQMENIRPYAILQIAATDVVKQ